MDRVTIKRDECMNKYKCMYIALACVFITGCGNAVDTNKEEPEKTQISTEQTEVMEAKREEPIVNSESEIDGIKYNFKEYEFHDVSYPVTHKSVISETLIDKIQLKNENMTAFSHKKADETGNVTEYTYYGNNFELPNFVNDENVTKITYILYNFEGMLGKSPIYFDNSLRHNIENRPIEIVAGENSQLYLTFLFPIVGSSTVSGNDYNDYREDLQKAIIEADIMYADGSEDTKYFGVRQKALTLRMLEVYEYICE